MHELKAARPGRPRGADIEERAYDTTLTLYAKKGWAGLTLGEVAEKGRLGKSSINLRWKSKGDLLTAALADFLSGHDIEDFSLGLVGSLTQHAMNRAHMYLQARGLAVMRLYLDARTYPDECVEIFRHTIGRSVERQRRALEEVLATSTMTTRSAREILDAIEGGVLMHVMVVPPELEARVRSKLPFFCERLVLASLGMSEMPVSEMSPFSSR